MRAEIIAVGTELLLGQIVNTNAAFISEKLAEKGIGVYYHTVVGDNPQRVEEVFRSALKRSDLVILTGGLGPTMDDLTKETVARVFKKRLIMNSYWEEKLESYFKKIGREMTENNRKQALIPEGSTLLDNHNGTAPGIFLREADKIVVMLPGPPREMQPMLMGEVLPCLIEGGNTNIIKSRVLKIIGIGESSLEARLQKLIKNQSNPTIAPLAKEAEVHLRLTARAKNAQEAQKMLERLEKKVCDLIGPYIYGCDRETLEEMTANLLISKNLSLALAESCTGGLVAHRLTEVPGSSKFLKLGVVAYSREAKEKLLNVEHEILTKYGEVSKQTAEAMAIGVKKIAQTDYSLAITGIAGPSGATDTKPVGLVYIALAWENEVRCLKFNFAGKRETIKRRAAITALNLLRCRLLKEF